MNYFDSINICLRKFFVFKGRASRSEFWYFAISYFFLVIILTFLLKEGSTKESFTFAKLFPMLIFAIPFYAVGARRLHDVNKSGLWQLVPIIISFFTDIRGMELEFTIFGLIAEIVLLIFLTLPGHKEDNKYGKKI